MPQSDELWFLQYVEGLQIVRKKYAKFRKTRDIEDYDQAEEVYVKLCEDYGISDVNFAEFITELKPACRQAPDKTYKDL